MRGASYSSSRRVADRPHHLRALSLGVLIRILRGALLCGSGDGGEGDGIARGGGAVGLLVCEEDDAADEDEDGDEDEEEGPGSVCVDRVVEYLR